MKKLPLLMLLAGLLAGGISTAPAADVTLKVTPERDVVYSEGSREVVVQIDLDGRKSDDSHRSPMNLAVVLDRSGSMAGPKIEKARQAACVAIDKLADDDYFSLVVFDEETQLLIPPTRVGSGDHRDELKARIDRIRPGGSTAIYAGVKLGAKQIREYLDKERVNRIVLLSDGLANVGPSRTSDLAELGRKLRDEGMSVTTIGLGDDYNEDLMTALAEASDANYYYVRDAEKLPAIFAQELGAARSIVARGVTIHITAPDGVHIREIIGRPEIDCDGRSVDIKMPEYFGSDQRRFLVRCTIDKPAKDSLEIVQVGLRYENGRDGKEESQQQSARVQFSEDQKVSEKSIRPEVAKDVAVTRNRLAKELAVKLADEGRAKDAAVVLRNQAVANAAAPSSAQIPSVAAENKKLEESASEVESGGSLSKASRKQMQYENWQDKYQKR